jgi:hypothetical protein
MMNLRRCQSPSEIPGTAWPSRIYALPDELHDHFELMQYIGEEDNENLLMTAPFQDRYRSARTLFLELYADPDTIWSNLTPEEFEIVWTAFLEAVAIHLPPSLRKKDNIRQLAKLVTRSKEVDSLIWQVISGQCKPAPDGTFSFFPCFHLCVSPGKRHGKLVPPKPLVGISTLAHLEGLEDKTAIFQLRKVQVLLLHLFLL